jgi:L,D-peptidoglycan transpeptidase YkuD (ErfK/YbiS/YcfS/YnhG family)
MKKRWFFLFGFILILVAFGFWQYRAKQQESPIDIINEARKKIAEAEGVLAIKFASKNYKNAVVAYDSAMIYWKKENVRFFLVRDYTLANKFAKRSFDQAIVAVDLAVKNKVGERIELQNKLDKLIKEINLFQNHFKAFPKSQSQTGDLTKLSLLVKEAEHSLLSANYNVCSENISKASSIIFRLTEHFQNISKEYFEEYSTWDNWVRMTISESVKTGTYCIIIDKIARECSVIKAGKLIKVFTLELGSNWIGDKNRQGDKATPEGMYKIVAKKERNKTKYYKALLLDYPNQEDKKRFLRNKQSGMIPASAKIGNLIEIHGHGGKGADWTEGCVALNNDDMDELYAFCTVGTRVTIVGSRKTYNEFIIR